NVASLLAHTVWPASLYWNIRQSFSGYRTEKPLTALMIWLGARFSKLPERILYNSEVSRIQHEAIGYQVGRSLLIPNGFLMEQFAPRGVRRVVLPGDSFDSDTFRVGLVGRDHPMKDLPNFFAA